jgi:uncharacterized protein YcfJ
MALQQIRSKPKNDEGAGGILSKIGMIGGGIIGGPGGAVAGANTGSAIGGGIGSAVDPAEQGSDNTIQTTAMQRRQSAIEDDPSRVLLEAEDSLPALPQEAQEIARQQLMLARQKLQASQGVV